MSKRNDFLAQIKRAQEAKATPAPEAKPPSEMTEAELDAEIRRLESEIRASQEEAVHLGRQEAAQQSRPATFGRIFKRNRRYWR